MNFFRITIVFAYFATFATLSAIAAPRQTREEYIEKYKSIAVAHMERYGIPASITMAQGLLESDAGNSELSRSSNNHFGIKCKKNWTGRKVYHDDDAKGECFRAYPTVEESYLDHAEFLDSSPRFAYPSTDYRSWARGLKAAGYATAPDYAERLVKIIETYNLHLLDQQNGAAIYSSGQDAKQNAEWFASQTTNILEREPAVGIDPFHVSSSQHKGYSVYRINHTCYIFAKEGDTFASLGKIFAISESTLRKFNDASLTATPAEGDMVYIERKKDRWLGDALLHEVAAGETLHSLSQQFGIRIQSLARLNRLKRSREITVGQTIRLR